MKEKVEKAAVTDVTYKDPITAVMVLAAGFGNLALRTEYREGLGQPKIGRAEIEKLSKSKDQTKAVALLWESLKPTLVRILTYSGPSTQTPKELRKEAEWIAELIGADLKVMFKEVCTRKGFTFPKSWAGLNADGTPKKQKTEDGKAKTEGGKPKADKAKKGKGKKVQTCLKCGCTGDKACVIDGVPCHWVEPDLCSGCVEEGEE
jgi:hypothetical protein